MTSTPRAMRVLVGAGVLGAGASWGLCHVRAETRRTLYPAPRPPAPLSPPTGWRVLGSPDEGHLAVYSPPPEPDAPTIIYCHGNAQEVATQLESLPRTLQQNGFGVAVVEYPGYGPLAAMDCCEDHLMSSALRAARDVQARPEVNRIVLVGLSLGTAVATHLASEGVGDLLLLAAPFTSAAEVTRALAGRWVPTRLLLGPERLDTQAKASQVTVPTLVITGEHDELFPPSMGRRLAMTFPNARFTQVPMSTHHTIRDNIPAALERLLSASNAWTDPLPAADSASP